MEVHVSKRGITFSSGYGLVPSTYFVLDFNSLLLYIKTNAAFHVFLYMY